MSEEAGLGYHWACHMFVYAEIFEILQERGAGATASSHSPDTYRIFCLLTTRIGSAFDSRSKGYLCMWCGTARIHILINNSQIRCPSCTGFNFFFGFWALWLWHLANFRGGCGWSHCAALGSFLVASYSLYSSTSILYVLYS